MKNCEHCDRPNTYPCYNTRDMEDAAINGDRECFYQLVKGGVLHGCPGEKGIDYVVKNCEALRARRYPEIAEAEAEATPAAEAAQPKQGD